MVHLKQYQVTEWGVLESTPHDGMRLGMLPDSAPVPIVTLDLFSEYAHN